MPNLIIARHAGQSIVIDEKITVTVLFIGRRTIRVAVEAPMAVNVRRGELPPRPTQGTTP